MSRSIGWVILGLFFLVLCWNVAADPLSGWHPSARDVFTIPTSMTQSGPASPILPIAEENNTTRNDNRSSSSVTAASIMLNQAPEQVGTRILVRYNRSEVSALADVEIEGVALQEDLSTSLPGLVIYETRNKSEEEAIKALSAVPGVLYAEPDYILSIDRIPNDPDLWRSWGISNTGQVYRENTPAGTAGADGKVLPAWDTATEADDVIIAVLDTGIDYTHPDLKANIWTGPSGEHGYNVINQTTDPMDDNGHGTHCAGIIGAVGNNGIGTAGISWKTKLMAVKAIGANGKAYTSDIIKGIEYATSAGAHIISCSFGGPEHSQALYDAIAQSQALFVCAAGNQGKNTDQNPYYPASYPLSNIIAVASTRADDTLSSSSNYGTTVHLAAPGENIYSTTIPVPGGNRYTYMTGTSQATAFVSGMCSLILSQAKTLKPADMRTLLITHSDPIPALAGKVAAQGRVNLSAALESISKKDAIPLHQGWNFVSVPRPLAAGKDTAQILGNVSSGGHSILAYETGIGWKTLKSTDPISLMTGYWVYSTKEDTVPLEYAPSPSIVTKHIQNGWNTWALPLKEPISAKKALSPIQALWKYVIGYNATLQQYETPILNGGSGEQGDEQPVKPYLGYWLYSTGQGEITG